MVKILNKAYRIPNLVALLINESVAGEKMVRNVQWFYVILFNYRFPQLSE